MITNSFSCFLTLSSFVYVFFFTYKQKTFLSITFRFKKNKKKTEKIASFKNDRPETEFR